MCFKKTIFIAGVLYELGKEKTLNWKFEQLRQVTQLLWAELRTDPRIAWITNNLPGV